MKKFALVIAAAIATLNSAYAQAPRAVEANAKQLRFTVGMGLTHGGDDLDRAEFENGTHQTIRAGGLVQFIGGVDYRINKDFSVQGNVGFHVDNATASNGDMHFRRYPVELLGYYHISPQWRVGGGVRYVQSVRGKASGAAGDYNFEFDNTTGGVIEAEYMVGYTSSVKVRVVRETYKLTDFPREFSGNHVGLFGNLYF